MILQHFSWQELLVVVLVFSIAWYIAVLLVFYRKKFLDFFNSKIMLRSAPLQHSAGVDKTLRLSVQGINNTENTNADVMGKTRLPEGMSVISADLIRFSDQAIPAEAG